MRRRLRHLPSCAVCAEIADAVAEWLGWLARAAETGGKISDVLPLCRRSRLAGAGRRRPGPRAGAAAVVLREAEERLGYADDAAARLQRLRLADRRLGVLGAARRGAALQAR